VVFATHKINILAQADYIMVINQGVIADFGERDVMLAKLTGAQPPLPPAAAPAPQPAH
jgi:ABC-type protease/lipase transport system fused ATPase/permease subunit